MLQISETPGEVLQAAAEYFEKTAKKAIASTQRFTVALSGGSSPKGLFQLLLIAAYKSWVDWSRVDLFLRR